MDLNECSCRPLTLQKCVNPVLPSRFIHSFCICQHSYYYFHRVLVNVIFLIGFVSFYHIFKPKQQEERVYEYLSVISAVE